MADSLVICEVDESLKEKLKKFRFRKETNNAAILIKIDMQQQLVVLEEEYEGYSSVECQKNGYRYTFDIIIHNISPEYLSLIYASIIPQDISLDDLREELPERQPRFIVYSYRYSHEDGRVSYPLCFILLSPVGCKPEQQMMYAGSKNRLVQTAEITKVFETRNAEDLTEEWLKSKLSFFR